MIKFRHYHNYWFKPISEKEMPQMKYLKVN
jgi:hypothetical protein